MSRNLIYYPVYFVKGVDRWYVDYLRVGEFLMWFGTMEDQEMLYEVKRKIYKA